MAVRQRVNAAVVFAFCGGCALLLACFLEPRLLFKFFELAIGCLVGVLLAALMAPLLSRLWARAGRIASTKLIACGAAVGLLAITAMGGSEAWVSDHEWLVGALARSGVVLSWQQWLGLWFGWLWPTGALLLVVASAFAAWLFGKAACSQTA